MGYSPPDRVMAATPIGLLGALHVLVSEAKKPCRTPLATGLHRNRTASDGQEPRLQPSRHGSERSPRRRAMRRLVQQIAKWRSAPTSWCCAEEQGSG